MSKIRPKERRAILDSLRAGVVPRIGLQHIHVGRAREIEALVRDIDNIADGGSAFRLIIGQYGSGKSFLLSLVQAIALEKKLVTARADLSPDRRLQATSGQARSLYAELMRNLATRARPEGGALASLLERFITQALKSAKESATTVDEQIHTRLAHLEEMTNGYDFATVVAAYHRGHESGDEALKQAAVRWLRGEYSTRTEARQALGVRAIIDDATVYDHLKLMARFARLAGYEGLLISLDEMVNLYKITRAQSRNANYEQLLRMLNDCLQGNAEGLGFVLGGTPEFLSDPRRGLYSYEALQSRLAENRFARDGLVDYSGPVIRLANLSQEDLYLLLQKIRHVAAGSDIECEHPEDGAIAAFLTHCFEQVGAAYFQTPRNSIKEWVNLLSILDQNPDVDWRDFIKAVQVERDTGGETVAALSQDEASGEVSGDEDEAVSAVAADDELSDFRL